VTTVLHALVGYFYLLLTIRVLRRRPGAQLTPPEFVLIFLIGGVIILATVGNDRSETNSIGAVLTVGLTHRLVSWAKHRFPKVGLVVDGTPLLLRADGEWRTDVMKIMSVTTDDVMAAARTQGIKTAADIDYAVLERNGAVSVIARRSS
jgi:uncharacterized membrane protein YcaP (DUF421 family)